MKKITTLCLIACTLISSNNAFGMLIKQTLHTKKYVKSVHTYKSDRANYIKEILSKRLDLDNWDRMYEGEEALKRLYFRNNTIIGFLHQDIGNIKAHINTLKEQQDFAIRGLGYDDEINELEKKLCKSFNIKKQKDE